MSNIINISKKDLEIATNSINERSEIRSEFSLLFVDTNVLDLITNPKNQVIYGRRGMGKTHLLGRLKEFYLDSFYDLKIIPIYIDARTLQTSSSILSPNTYGISILIMYRRVIDRIIEEIKEFIFYNYRLDIFEKIWPGKKTEKIKKIYSIISKISTIIRFGESEHFEGEISSTLQNIRKTSKEEQMNYDLKLIASLHKLPEINTNFGIGATNSSSQNVEESLQILYKGLTTLHFNKIGLFLDDLINELELTSIVIIFDEWTTISIDLQPLFAEMIKSTLVSGRNVFIKFGCIPVFTNLSKYDKNYQSIGFPIGEEIFVDADLDTIYNAYTDPDSVSIFLEKVLQKHLGYKIPTLLTSNVKIVSNYFRTKLFENSDTFKELSLASAGVPRDFLRIFVKAFRDAKNPPITMKNVRRATHSFYTTEKQILVKAPKILRLFETIFRYCLNNRMVLFFVSEEYSEDELLKQIWHNRLIHLIYKGHQATDNNITKTFDVYVIDYGKYIQMTSDTIGEDVGKKIQLITQTIINNFDSTKILSKIWTLVSEKPIKKYYAKQASSKIIVDPNVLNQVKLISKDASPFVIDKFFSSIM